MAYLYQENGHSLVPRYFPLKFPMSPFTLKALNCCSPKCSFKSSVWTTIPHTERKYLQTSTLTLSGKKKFLWIQTCLGVRKNSTENLAHFLARNTSYKLPAITIALKLAFCATGIDYVVLYSEIKLS